MRIRRRILTLTFGIVIPTLFLAGPAGAVPGCEGEAYPIPESASDGLTGAVTPEINPDDMDAPPATDTGNWLEDGEKFIPPDSDLFAEYGTAGLSWHTITSSCIDKVSGAPIRGLADSTWELAKAINLLTIVVFRHAMTGEIVSGFGDFTADGVMELRESVWRPLLPSVVILGAVWMAWVGLVRKKASMSFEGAAWMILAVVLGMLIIGAPHRTMDIASSITVAGSDLAHDVVSAVPVPIEDTTVCPPGAVESGPARDSAELDPDSLAERSSERLWAGLICRPWLVGLFGSGDHAETAAQQHALGVLNASAITRSEQYHITTGDIDADDLYSAKAERYEEIAEQIEDDPAVFLAFEGAKPSARLGVATLALVAGIAAGGMVAVASIALILMHLAFMLLLLLAPFFFLVGIHPGAGRILLIRWLEMAVGMLLKQIVVTFALLLLMAIYTMVLGAAWPWGGQMMVLAMITLAFLVYRWKFRGTITAASKRVIGSSAAGVVRTGVSAVPGGAVAVRAWDNRETIRRTATTVRDHYQQHRERQGDSSGSGRPSGPRPSKTRRRSGPTPGARGTPGDSGAPGTSGTAGTSGRDGATGGAGSSGAPGRGGASGPPGPRRDTGGYGATHGRQPPPLPRSDGGSQRPAPSSGSQDTTRRDTGSGPRRESASKPPDPQYPRYRGDTWGDHDPPQRKR